MLEKSMSLGRNVVTRVPMVLTVAALLAIAAPAVGAKKAKVERGDKDWVAEGSEPGGLPTEIVAFMVGPDTPPLGHGSLLLGTPLNGHAILRYKKFKSTGAVTAFGTGGVPLIDITRLTYSTYVWPTSANPQIAPAIKLPITSLIVAVLNTSSGFATLVFEPLNSVGPPVVQNNWQAWDTLDADARWWATRPLPGGVCSQAAPCSYATLVATIPDAVIFEGGPHVGLGSGNLRALGNVDALTIGVAGKEKAFDFEPAAKGKK